MKDRELKPERIRKRRDVSETTTTTDYASNRDHSTSLLGLQRQPPTRTGSELLHCIITTCSIQLPLQTATTFNHRIHHIYNPKRDLRRASKSNEDGKLHGSCIFLVVLIE